MITFILNIMRIVLLLLLLYSILFFVSILHWPMCGVTAFVYCLKIYFIQCLCLYIYIYIWYVCSTPPPPPYSIERRKKRFRNSECSYVRFAVNICEQLWIIHAITNILNKTNELVPANLTIDHLSFNIRERVYFHRQIHTHTHTHIYIYVPDVNLCVCVCVCLWNVCIHSACIHFIILLVPMKLLLKIYFVFCLLTIFFCSLRYLNI